MADLQSLVCKVSLAICILSTVAADILVLPIDGHFIADEFRDKASSFGASLPYEGLRGMLTYADPPDACTSLKGPPDYVDYKGKWIVLISRSPENCSFEHKVRMAQNASYDGVIVHNIGSDELEPMFAKNKTGIFIPSVFVSETTGRILQSVYCTPSYFVIVNSEVPFNFNSNLLIPFAIVVGICFIVMVIFMVVKFIKDRRRQRRHRLPSSTLNKIPTCKFAKGDPYDTCAICLEDYIEGEKLRVLPCAHAYHCKCIDPWLTKNRRVCPVCKRKVFAQHEPHNSSDSDSDTDDTTPLMNSSNQNSHNGGTFDYQSENPFQRAARSISQHGDGVNLVTASGHHSINGEIEVSEDSDNSSSNSSTVGMVSGNENDRLRLIVQDD
ncbi:hypothetical protein FQA39_LY08121 [Lamprigera yunnana]|nr:hypothetical protein FQA39_LY08121 [Lamprigera yunnana]